MRDLARRLQGAARRDAPRWDEARTEAALSSLHTAVRRRSTQRRVILAAGAVAVAIALAAIAGVSFLGGKGDAIAHRARGALMAGPSGSVTPDGVLRFWDGSTATPIDTGTALMLEHVAAERVIVGVARGSGRFDVTRNPRRVFRVRAGGAEIVVLGTRFVVERRGERARVRVERGHVRVEWHGGARVLDVGEEGWFPPGRAGEPPPPSLAPIEPAATTPERGHARRWRALADQGDYRAAFDALRIAPPSAVRDEPAELLVAADAARLSGHAADALPYLRRVLRDHRGDPRAALAAFTLGRVLLGELGRPGEAAAAFADARSLSPSGSLAEDALAREVEAWSRAGDASRARDRATRYGELYPQGRRARAVRLFGGL